MRLLFGLFFCLLSNAWANDDELSKIINSAERSVEAKARDSDRHPYETLTFFGIKPDMTVVELWPGGGWYSDIIAPYIAQRGDFIAAHFNPDSEHEYVEFFRSSLSAYQSKLQGNSAWYKKVVIKPFEPPNTPQIAQAGSVDMVLSFRNMHGWLVDERLNEILDEVRVMLRPGGVFGVVDHRANPEMPLDKKADNGYINEKWLIGVINSAGFQLVASSEINANPNDTANHPNGVWSLPPRLALGPGENRSKYLNIGESDRFTLKFVKLGR